MSIAVALIVVNRPNSQASTQSDPASTQANATSTFTVYAPYWSTKPGFVSTIEMMNYRVDEPLTVRPVVYPLGGGEIALDPITLNPSETRLLNINEALAARGETVTIGAAEIRYNHVTEAVFGANLTAVNVDKSLIYSAPLHGPEDTEQLEGIWWFWDSGTDGFVAVQNAGAEKHYRDSHALCSRQPYRLDSLQLNPHEMKLINLRENLRGFGLEAATNGGIQLVSSVAGAVVAAGSLDNPAIGFSAPIRMGDPQVEAERSKPLATARKLHALNLSIGTPLPEMGLPSTTVFKPVVVLRNVARSVIQVQPVFRYQVANSQRSFALPTVRLNSQQVAQLDLLRYWQSGQIPHEVSTGSLEMRYTGKPGSLFASATSVDQTGTYVLDARIDNHLAAGFAGEFWCIEGDNNTFVSVKNISGSAATCSISLRYDAGRGVYEMQPLRLESGEMRVINLKRLQAKRIPGANGEILPESAAFGGMKFVEEPGGKRFLVEGGVFNPVTGTCGVCGFGCLYPLSLITIPGGLDLVVGLISNGLSVQANMCDGTHQLGWQCQCDFVSNDPTVATVNEFCTHYVTGVNPGNAFTNGTAVDVPGPHCGEQTLFVSCAVAVTGPPDHVKVIVDNLGFPAQCPSTGIFVRQMQMQVVDSNNNAVKSAFSIQESFSNLSANTCGNGNPAPSSCAAADTGGKFLDTMAVSSNLCNSGISQSSGCGFSLTSTWSICSGSTNNTIWTSPRDVRSNSISVNGQSTKYNAGTIFH